jgi:hypothetical protein
MDIDRVPRPSGNQAGMSKPISAEAIENKINGWATEAHIAACRAFQMGIKPSEVVYPSGMRMQRFAEPSGAFGIAYEVTQDVWRSVVESSGKLPLQYMQKFV